MSLHLMSHALCPYVQRAVIALREKNVAFERTYIDLANKPDWFIAISPLGKTPVLIDNETPIFESTVILEYLEETQPDPLHPHTALERAIHRSWVEFSSAVLSNIGGFYNAQDAECLGNNIDSLKQKFERLESEISNGPYFSNEKFSLVDIAFAPVFRYFDVFDQIDDFGILADTPKVSAWRKKLALRPSVIDAVSHNYGELLHEFLSTRQSYLSQIINNSFE